MRVKFAASAFAIVLAVGVREAWSQPLQKLLVGWSSPSGNQAVIWVAKEAGSFQRQGLDVELIFVGAGSKMIQAFLGGDIKIAQVGGVAPVSARLRGAELKIVAVSFNTLALSVMAHKDIRFIADLKGKRVGVSRYGSNTDFGIRYILKRNGLVPDKDVAILQFGDVVASFAALQAGAVQASIISYPTIALAKKAGFRELADIAADASFEYPGTNIVVTDRYLRSQQDIIRRFLAAYIEGIHRYKSDERFAKRMMTKHLRIDDSAILDDTYKFTASKLPRIPYPTSAGFRLALESITDDPRAKSARPEEFFDDTILHGLEREGLLQQPSR